MARIDKQIAVSMRRLKSPEMAPFVGYLENLRKADIALLIKSNDMPFVHRLQGRLDLLDSILNTVTDIDALIAKLDKP
jgi:hypothetical protein